MEATTENSKAEKAPPVYQTPAQKNTVLITTHTYIKRNKEKAMQVKPKQKRKNRHEGKKKLLHQCKSSQNGKILILKVRQKKRKRTGQ
jgi:hypothetical protein